MRDLSNKMSGFTLIELLVVIAIIGVLSSIVIASLNNSRARARDAKRVSELANIRTSLEIYYTDNDSYPSTGSLNSVYADLGCTRTLTGAGDQNTANWVPGLVPNYISSLPKDPKPEDQARGSNPSAACYMYASDGTSYILSAWATVESGPQTSKMYSRAGFRGTSFGDQRYLCDNLSVGNPAYGDYYKYSYTLTNVNCVW